MNNEFLIKLLTLQQDGSGAISAPTNWTEEPLLEIETELDPIIHDLSKSILQLRDQNKIGRWHFFIGSPGNGKSAAVGKLCRILIEKGCLLLTEKEHIDIKDLEPDHIPYLLEVYEEGQRYSSAWIAQDASVVKNPFSPDVDPAKELIDLLEEAWHKGVSLVICTNRGVIEKAFRRIYLDPEKNRSPWFRGIKLAVEDIVPQSNIFDFDHKTSKKPFNQFSFTFKQLDSHSLLIGSNAFSNLILKATDSSNWTSCNTCSASDLCPFKLNRDWLCHKEDSRSLVNILRRGELFGGQIIVFREALTLLSFILAGCPKDYERKTPCSWVHSNIDKENYFVLASRRIYMNLFSSYTTIGIEHSQNIRDIQIKKLKEFRDIASDDDDEGLLASISNIFKKEGQISTDVGTSRLLGQAGILRKLDPFSSPLPRNFLDKWDGDCDFILNHESELITSLEKKCCEIWKVIENKLELSSEVSVEVYHWLCRWISAFTIRLGSMIEGYTSFSNEIDELLEIISFRHKKLEEKDIIRLDVLNKNLEKLLNPQTEEGLVLSEYVSISGQWPINNLHPRIKHDPKSKYLGLIINYGGDEEIPISAETFIWLKRKLDLSMSAKSFPSDLLEAARDEQVCAASRSGYAYQDDNILLLIKRPDGLNIRLKRTMGEVYVEPQ